MPAAPNRDELLSRIEKRYRRDMKRAEDARDTALAAIRSVDPAVIETLALLLVPDQEGNSVAVPAASVARVVPRPFDMLDEVLDDVLPDQTPSGYGGVSRRIREAVQHLDGDFTVHDIIAKSAEPKPKGATIAGVMKRMMKEGTVELVQQGAGKRPSTFRRIDTRDS